MIPATLSPESAALLLERRRERTKALRACRPIERQFLKQLPKSRYSPYVAGKALGYSDSTVWKFMQRGRVKHAMELFLRDALEEIGVSHASLVADLQHIKEQCIKHLVTDPKAAAGAIAAVGKLMELTGYNPAKRIEVTGRDGEPLAPPVFNISFDDGAPGEYGIDVSHPMGDDPAHGQSTH